MLFPIKAKKATSFFRNNVVYLPCISGRENKNKNFPRSLLKCIFAIMIGLYMSPVSVVAWGVN